MKIIKNNNLLIDCFNYDVVLIPMNINNAMSNGFLYDIALNFPEIKENEETTGYGDKRKYGTIFPIEYNNTIFCICYMYEIAYNRKNRTDFVNYDALKNCLKEVRKKYSDKCIASPLLGCSKYDGTGNKEKIYDIFSENLSDMDVYIYDFEQEDFKHKIFCRIAELHDKLKNKKISEEEYILERSKVEWKRKNGIFKEMPKDFIYNPKKI